jgi:hypothetical protein
MFCKLSFAIIVDGPATTIINHGGCIGRKLGFARSVLAENERQWSVGADSAEPGRGSVKMR